MPKRVSGKQEAYQASKKHCRKWQSHTWETAVSTALLDAGSLCLLALMPVSSERDSEAEGACPNKLPKPLKNTPQQPPKMQSLLSESF